MSRTRFLEVLLLQVVVYLALWVLYEYLASLLSVIIGVVCLAILVLSLIVELVERSNVPRWYYHLMLISIVAPAIAAGLYKLTAFFS